MNQNESKTNIVAILGFIFSLILGGVGLILSILGLIESKKTNNGKVFIKVITFNITCY